MSNLYGSDGKLIDPSPLARSLERFKDIRLSGMKYEWFDRQLVDQYGNYLNPPTRVGKTYVVKKPITGIEIEQRQCDFDEAWKKLLESKRDEFDWFKKYVMGNWDISQKGGENNG